MHRRFMFQTPIVNRDGLYSYQPLSPERARIWLDEGADPLFRMPLIGSVVKTLTGRDLPVNPGERLTLHTGDEALIVLFRFPEDEGLPGYKRGQIATRPRDLGLSEIREHIGFGLLRKFARLDGYTLSVTQWDSAHRDDGGSRYLVHDALLDEFGTYEFARCDVESAAAWLNEDRYVSQLRYDGTCKALELLADHDITLWESNSKARLTMRPGDQALVAFFHYPGGQNPRPFETYAGPLSPAYVRANTSLSFLTRLSDEFVQRNTGAFPTAALRPGGGVYAP